MDELSGLDFGLVIAFLIPGLVALGGVGELSPTLHAWLLSPASDGPTVANFLFMVLASIGAGVTVSAVRWAVIDTIHHRTGVVQPRWDDAALPDRVDAFARIVEGHYRYYQFYANMLISLPWTYALLRRRIRDDSHLGVWADLLIVFLCVVFFAGSRDALRKYYRRTERLLGPVSRKGDVMTNGEHHGDGGKTENVIPKVPKDHPMKKEATKVSAATRSKALPKGK